MNKRSSETVSIAEVLVFRGVPSLYTYRIPDTLKAEVGMHVRIPFGKSPALGVVMRIGEAPAESDRVLRAILGPEDSKPALPADLVAVIEWIQVHYLISPFQAYQTVVNKQLKKLDVPELESDDTKATDIEPLMSGEQAHAVTEILARKGGRFLVFGVTASGKTEVYMRVAKSLLENGKSAIILVPEIALTPQFRRTFTRRFGKQISVLHSKLTPKQRNVEWNRMAEGIAKIAIGPRSAIFAPVRNLGAIMMDEEHEATYKQESTPRYETAEIAQFRRAQSGCALILGSATPRVETFYAAECSDTDDPLQKIELKERVKKQPMPDAEIVDMKVDIQAGNDSILSTQLRAKIEDRLRKKEKVMILVNRRGFAPYVRCRKCGTMLTCPSCGLGVTYHSDKKFRCHRCVIQMPVSHECPACHQQSLIFGGIGTQKAELELKSRYPEAHVSRLDRDTATTQKKLEEILKSFEEKGDILIGTQLIAKGHDFPAVTLVGVLGIDSVLSIPDFRSCERTFQLVTQVAGRSGRGDVKGEVVIQTLEPAHYALEYASRHDYLGFYKQEIEFRRLLNYPPFCQLINILFSGESLKEVRQTAEDCARSLDARFPKPDSEDIVSAAHTAKPAPLEKFQDRHRWHILIKCAEAEMAQYREFLKQYLEKRPKKSLVSVDFNPRNIF